MARLKPSESLGRRDDRWGESEEEEARGDLRPALRVRGGAWPVLNTISRWPESSVTRGSNIKGGFCGKSGKFLNKCVSGKKTHIVY